MATANDTFERKEKKYLISAEQCAAIKAGLSAHMRLDDYGATRIDSLYLDTPERSLICRSLEKPIYKEKLRIRSYGPLSEAESVFVEIKKKFKGIVYKRRVKMGAQDALHCFSDGVACEEVWTNAAGSAHAAGAAAVGGTAQIAREIDAFRTRYPGLAPSMLISCVREAWCPIDPDDPDCVDRITFDEDIEYVDLMDGASVHRDRVTAPGQVVMEIKCALGYPLWLCSLLSSVGAYPRSFSKYGNAFKRVLAAEGNVFVTGADSGKVSIHRIPRKPKHAKPDELLGPSEGFEQDALAGMAS